MLKSFSMLLCCSLLAASGLTGCTGAKPAPAGHRSTAKSSDASPPAFGPPPTKDDRPVIVAFGDSLTAGYGAPAGRSYPDYLQRDLNARGYRYRVVNAGISGNTTKDGVSRVDRIVAMHPVVTIVAFGGNDGLRGIPIADSEKNLNTILSTLRKAHIKIILGGITLPPNYGPDYIHAFDAIFHEVAEKYHVALVPMIYKNLVSVPGTIQPDGIHPTAKGAVIVANTIWPVLKPLLRKSGD